VLHDLHGGGAVPDEHRHPILNKRGRQAPNPALLLQVHSLLLMIGGLGGKRLLDDRPTMDADQLPLFGQGVEVVADGHGGNGE